MAMGRQECRQSVDLLQTQVVEEIPGEDQVERLILPEFEGVRQEPPEVGFRVLEALRCFVYESGEEIGDMQAAGVAREEAHIVTERRSQIEDGGLVLLREP